MDQKKTGAFISDLRKEKGLTQEALGQALGVNQKTVSRWETGRNMPDLATIPELCELLDISVSEFINGEKSASELLYKEDVTQSFRDLTSAFKGKLERKKIAGAIISFILMVVCMFGLYNMEFSVRTDSTSQLEAAINEYNFDSDLLSDVLEMETLGNRSFVLYRAENHKGCTGIAELEKGIFGKYRILEAKNTNYPLISVGSIKAGGRYYAVLCCTNDLPEVRSFDVLGYPENGDHSSAGPEVILSEEYTGAPFLTLAELEDKAGLISFPEGRVYYDSKGEEINREELELSFESDEDFGGSTFTAERGLIYVYEAIILILGIVLIRFFLSK